MSASTRVLGGVQIDVASLFHVQVDYAHLQVTITAILDALSKQQERADQADRMNHEQQKQIEVLEGKVQLQGQKLVHSEGEMEKQQILLGDLSKKDAAAQARILHLEQSLKDLTDTHLPKQVREHQVKIEKLESILPRLTALEEENKSLRSRLDASTGKMLSLEQQTAQAEDQARAAKHAADLAARESKDRAHGQPEKVVETTVIHAPQDPSHNYDALNTKLAKLTGSLEALQTRVVLLENRPISSGSSSGDFTGASSGDLDALQQAGLQTSRQLAATMAELSQLRAQVQALEKAMQERALKAVVEGKADKKSLSATDARVDALEREGKELQRQLKGLQEQFQSLQNTQSLLQNRLAQLLEQTACSHCGDPSPTVKCRQCRKSYCDACDELIHGAGATEEFKAHLRTPLGGGGLNGITAAVEPVHTHRSVGGAYNSDDLNELRKWAEDLFNLYARKEKATRGDIHELYTKDKDLRAKLSELLKANESDRKTFEEIMAAIKKMEQELRNAITNGATQARNYTDNRIEELLLKLRELEKALERGMKSELKRFERDVLVFMESNNSSTHDHGQGGDASVGKIHFRCLSCDQHVGNLQGPSSLLYARAIGQGTAAAQNNPNATNMNIDRGRELFLNGRDGGVYKGREPSVVTIAPGDSTRPANFQVHYSDRMSTTNPKGASVYDQKTVKADQYGSYAPTPQRIPTRPSTAGESLSVQRQVYSSSPDSLPPTRPSTRGGVRPATRQGIREEEKTPVKEQLTATAGF